MRFIGDVHGKYWQYINKLDDVPTFQLGDMGLGFERLEDLPAHHRFLRGNHDSPAECRTHPNYVGEFGYLPEHRLFFISGAFSIDQEIRKVWMRNGSKPCWWPDEELSPEQFAKAFELYRTSKPEIVASHDCPDIASNHLLRKLAIGFRPEKLVETRTGEALQQMWEAHKPKVWIFGHYHIDADFTIDGTRFICRDELSVIDIEHEDAITGAREVLPGSSNSQ